MSLRESIQKISRGTTEIINIQGLEQKLISSQKSGKPLIIKAGFDPTAPDIHLGHTVLLRKLKHFQELGHTVYFLIGDFTAQIGDPTGRNETRPPINQKQILKNAKTYKEQVFRILDAKKTKVVFNSRWLKKFSAKEILELVSLSTVAQMLARADFKERFEHKREISLLEFVYPLLQGYDSVHLKADVELGGSDQKFNLLMGRQIQESFGQQPQVVIMTPLLEGLDGVNKMSKSLGNYIGITEPPQEIFGKVMSVSDELMMRYYEFLTDADLNEVKKLHPKEAKLQLAQSMVDQFYGKSQALHAREDFEKTFSQKQTPQDIIEYSLKENKGEKLADILIKFNMASSRNEVRRLLRQGAITHEGNKVVDEDWPPQEGVLKVGKRRFLRLIWAISNGS